MNNLQTRKESIEKEIAETREYINSLGDTPQDDIRWEREMRYCSRLRTELLEINNKIAKAEKATTTSNVATTPEAITPEPVEEVATEVELPAEAPANDAQMVMAQIEKSMAQTKRNLAHTEALYNLLKEALSTPVAEAEPITQPIDEPAPQNPVMRAYTALMAQVKHMPQYNEDSFKMLSNQPSLVQVEFRGVANAHTILLDVMEYGNGDIYYQLEKELLDTSTYSALFKTDDKNLALKYIQKEISTISMRPSESKDSYRKLLPELKQARLSGEVDATDMEYYADRISALNEAGKITEKQLDKLNRYMDELTDNWIAEK